MTGQHDNRPVTTVIYKPNEHADEYIVIVDDVAEVGWRELLDPCAPLLSRNQLSQFSYI